MRYSTSPGPFFAGFLMLSFSFATAAAAPPADRLAEAEARLLENPPEALALAVEAAGELPLDVSVEWRGEALSAEELQERVAALTEAYKATENRVSFAAYCLDRLQGPDRVGLATEVALRHVREGRIEVAVSLAAREELAGEARMRLLGALAAHFRAAGEPGPMEEAIDEILEIYPRLHSWVQGLVRDDLADRLVALERPVDVVGLAHEAGGWKQPYYLSRIAEAFPNWKPDVLRDQALGLAQKQDPAEQSLALVRLAAEFVAAGQAARGETLLEAAEAIAIGLEGREKVLAFAALAEFAARRERTEETVAHFDRALSTILKEMEGWEQTDALIELASRLADTPAAPVAGSRIEKASVLLSGTAEEVPMRNKYRVYEFRGVAAATSPAGAYGPEERRGLFAEWIRIEAMPEEEEEAEA